MFTNQMITDKDDSFILPFAFIVTSFFCFLLFAIHFAITPSAFTASEVRTATGLSLAHLFILGWLTMIAMGAIYQLMSVITQQAVYSTKLGFLHYILYTVGVFGLYQSLVTFQVMNMAIFGTLLIIGVILFISNVFFTISKAKLFNPIIIASISALIYLGLTVIFGLLLVLNFRFGILGELQIGFLLSHMWFGLVGWFLFLIIGYSFKMLPMFYLAHGHSEKIQKWILLTLHVAVIFSMITALMKKATLLFPVSLALLLLSLVLFLIHIKQIQSKRFKNNPGKGITFFVILVYLLAISNAIIFILAILDVHFVLQKVLAPVLFFYIFGFVSLSILSYLSKITPFLWWTFRYGKQVGQTETPSLASMMNEKIVYGKLWFHLLTLVLFIISLFMESSAISILTYVLSFSMIYYMFTILKTFTY